MSYCGTAFVFLFVVSIISCIFEFPIWFSLVTSIASYIFWLVSVSQFDKMEERVRELEKELQKRKDGADNER